MVGKNIVQIAEMWKMEPVDACLRLIEEEKASVGYIGHAMSPENVELVLSHPLVMVSSDGYSIAAKGKALEEKLHPRSYGTYPRFLAHYIRERKIVDLPAGIRKMTSMPAEQAGLNDRGRIAKGKKADLVIFNPKSSRYCNLRFSPSISNWNCTCIREWRPGCQRWQSYRRTSRQGLA